MNSSGLLSDDLSSAAAFWPTPADDVGDKDTDLTPGMANRDHSTGNLIEGVAKFLKQEQQAMWSTPTAKIAEDSQTHRGGDRAGELLLTGQATGGLWSTPRAIDSMCRETLREADAVRREIETAPRGGTTTGKLEDQIALWSTPRASDGEKGGPGMTFGAGGTPLPTQASAAALWMTPSATDHKGSTAPGAGRGQLSEQTEADSPGTEEGWGETPTGLWPTPNAEEATGYMSGSNRDTWRPTLSGLVQGKAPVLHQGRPSSPPAPPTGTPGGPSSQPAPGSPPPSPRKRLNPRFVEWLMGLPPGWVTGRVDPSSFACWATASSRSVLLPQS